MSFFSLNIRRFAALTVCLVCVQGTQVIAQDTLSEPVLPGGSEEGIDDLDFLTGEPNQALPDEIVPMPEAIMPEESMPEEVIETQIEEVPQPAMEELASPSAEEMTSEAGASEDFPPSPEPDIPTLLPQESGGTDESLFFDAEQLVPTGEMGTKGGPVKVNPRLQPGSKLIIVKKNHGAGSKQAQLVSAERAVKLGRYESALSIYDLMYAKNKRDPKVLMGRATVLQHLGRNEEALFAYEELLEVLPANLEAQINMLGLMGQRYPAVALQRLIELRDKNPEHVGIVAQIAVIQAELGRYDEALQYLGIAASMEPNNPSHLFNIAVIADRAGNKKEAISYYEQALESDSIYGGGRAIPREAIYERLAQLR